MKSLYIGAPLAALLMLSACAEEENVAPTAERSGITSFTAMFTSGENLDRVVPSADGTSTTTTWTVPADFTGTDYVIPIPYYYPEESNNTMEEAIKAMKVKVQMENNCMLSPSIKPVMDLTQKYNFVYTDPYGKQQPITITGALTRSPKCALKSITIQPGDLTGIIDEEAKTVSVLTANDLSEATAEVVLDPHATISPDPTKPFDMNKGYNFTVTADNGTTKANYKVIRNVPEKVPSGYASGSEKELWQVDMTTLGVTTPDNTHPTLAATGSYVIMNLGDGSAPQYFRVATGTKMGEMVLGDAVPTGAITSDNAGNVLISNFAANGETMNIYVTNDVTKAPKLLLSYQNGLGVEIGARLHVQGDINGDAVITATPYSCQNAIRWKVKGGKVGDPENMLFSSLAAWGGQDDAAKVVALDNTGAKGALVDYYQGGACQMYYLPDWATATGILKDTGGSAWGFNTDAIDYKEFNNSAYAVLFEQGYWPSWGLTGHIYLYDGSNPAGIVGEPGSSTALKYTWTTQDHGSAAAGGRFGDVLLVPSENGFFLNIFWCSNTHLTLGAAQVDCIKK